MGRLTIWSGPTARCSPARVRPPREAVRDDDGLHVMAGWTQGTASLSRSLPRTGLQPRRARASSDGATRGLLKAVDARKGARQRIALSCNFLLTVKSI